MDLDGDLDILLIDNSGTLSIYEQTGNGPLKEHISTVAKFPYVSSLNIADIGGDPKPDVFIGQLWGTYPVPGTNYLLGNAGNFSFSDESNLIYPFHDGTSNFSNGVVCDPNNQNTWLSGGNTNRRSRGSQFVDVDMDGKTDLFISNYFLERDELYLGREPGLPFESAIGSTSIDKNRTGSNHGTGVHWEDYDNDGDPDLLLPQFAHPSFSIQYDHRYTSVYRNDGDALFTDTYPNNGIQFEETFAGGTWGDVNNDGLLDFYITVFYGCRYVKIYLQQPDHSFKLEIFKYGLNKLNTGQDAIWVDFNNDGLLDLCTGNNGRIRLYQNVDPNAGRAIQFVLVNENGDPAIGATIEISTETGKQTRRISAGRGVRMQDPYRIHFGTGNNELVLSATVRWADGTETSAGPFFTESTPGNLKPVQWKKGEDVHGIFGQAKNRQPELLIFPNPIQFEKSRAYIRLYEDSKLIISNLSGSVILEDFIYRPNYLENDQSHTFAYTFPKELSSGIYLLQVIDQVSNLTSEVVKIVVP